MNTSRIALFALLVFFATLARGIAYAQDQTKILYAPTGPYQVGVTVRQWTDESRDEVYTANPDDKHTVTVWIWYPADIADGATLAPYVQDPDNIPSLDIFSMLLGVSTDELGDRLSSLQLAAYPDSPVAAAMPQYPVVVYFDPLSGLPVDQGAQVQDLASHGYVVVDILHTYGYPVTLGEQLGIGDALFDWSLVEWEKVALPDISFILDRLPDLNAEDLFAERLDLEKVGLVGYSAGGSIAIQATAADGRVKAAISEDGLPAAFDYAEIEQPYMLMQAEEDLEGAFPEFGGPVYLVASDQLIHFSFSDAMLWPNNLDLATNIVDGVRGTQIINAYVIAFFDRYLKGEEQPLLQGPSDDFPEVDIQSLNLNR